MTGNPNLPSEATRNVTSHDRAPYLDSIRDQQFVMPAEAGIQSQTLAPLLLDSRLRGNDGQTFMDPYAKG